MVLKPVYLALFSLTLLAVIAGSGAVMALVGQGRDVMLFGLGVGFGMSLVSALSLELVTVARRRLEAMQETIVGALWTLQVQAVNPRFLLNGYNSAPRPVAPQNASDITLELECRRLLDRMRQLLENTADEAGQCRYCQSPADAHESHCPVLAAQVLYQAGKEKRIPWREYQKTLPQDVR